MQLPFMAWILEGVPFIPIGAVKCRSQLPRVLSIMSLEADNMKINKYRVGPHISQNNLYD